MAIHIESDTTIDIESSFKITAGPGAGKTHWLSTHICNVMHKSKRLGVTRKIACISYTNVGADTIKSRLPIGFSSFVEVCTIHSFLYNNVIKPFLHLESSSFGIDIKNLQIEPPKAFLTKSYVAQILRNENSTWVPVESMLEGLSNCQWRKVRDKYIFKPQYPIKVKKASGGKGKYNVPQKLYDAYVSERWKKGYISYDDIIYLSTELINRQPKILNLIKAKFPYFFIDEFQDSVPAVVDIVKKLGEIGVVVGVVGDTAQTIYDFIGASIATFENFTVPDMEEYEIHGNRRSTSSIINLLNRLRPNFLQEPIGTDVGRLPILLVGDKLLAYEKAIEISRTQDVHTLAYKNIVANNMLMSLDSEVTNKKLLDEEFEDSDMNRSLVVRTLLKATEYAYQNNLNEAWSQLDMIDNDRTITIRMLRKLHSHRKSFLGSTLYVFFHFLQNVLSIQMANLISGRVKTFYESHNYEEFSMCVGVADSDSTHKTIHKAKGEEYDNVMVILGGDDPLEVLHTPNLIKKPAHRVYYVGMSRARKNLFINVREINNTQQEDLNDVPIEIIRV